MRANHAKMPLSFDSAVLAATLQALPQGKKTDQPAVN
jgi:hypothetical protein